VAKRLTVGFVPSPPPLPQDFNPIEKLFALLKRWLRRHESLGRFMPEAALMAAVRSCANAHVTANTVHGCRGDDGVTLYEAPYFPSPAEEEELAAVVAAVAAAVVVLCA
jgi:hypothetical protein